jgi:chromosomal replication initiator protein
MKSHAVASSAQDLWQTTLGDLRLQIAPRTFDTWLKGTAGLSIEDGTLVVGVPNTFTKEFLEHRLGSDVDRAVARVAGGVVTCAYVVRSVTADGHGNGNGPLFEQVPLPADDASRSAASLRLNARYTFDSFIVGAGNRLAHAAAQAVAEHVGGGNGYNPLFIYGGVGLGKTHLLHAIGHSGLARGARVRAVSSEQFTNDLINAIGTNRNEEFRSLYRDADLLLVDDIHFIAGKERTQEEFFHTFNWLYAADAKIVVTSDRPPQAISTLEERLRSRFQWGLLVDIEPPDLETRIAILRAKLDRTGPSVPAPVLELIAQAVQHNVRELEGALNRVVAYAQINHLSMGVETARRALADLMVRREPPALEAVLRAVGAHYRLDVAEIVGRSRVARVSEPRQVAMYLMREDADASFPAIGAFLGGRDHTTVLHGCDKIARLVDRDAKLRRDVMQIRERMYAA